MAEVLVDGRLAPTLILLSIVGEVYSAAESGEGEGCTVSNREMERIQSCSLQIQSGKQQVVQKEISAEETLVIE